MSKILSLALSALLVLTAPMALARDVKSERQIATAAEVILPVIAGACAVQQHRARDFAVGFLAQTAVVEGLKYGLGNNAINQRPRGGTKGFPSGHTATAFYGATNIARKCVPDRPLIGALAYGAALAVGLSRINTRDHNALQVGTGAVIGIMSNGISLSIAPEGAALGFSMSF